MRRTALLGLAVVAAIATGASACSSSSSPSSTGTTGSKGGSVTLTIESNPLPSFTDNFNPFLSTSLGHEENVISYMYEPLLELNALQPGVVHDWLASNYAWSDSGKTLTFTLRTGVKWSDGQPFTSADVAYTYQLIKDNKALNGNGLTISSVSAPDANTVVLTFPTAQYANLFSIAGNTFIVPKHLWSSVSDPSTYTDPNPVGTGPYLLSNFAATGLTFKKNPSYWFGPSNLVVSQINVPAYSGNSAAELALSQGSIDWAGNQIPNVQQIFVNKSSNNHTYFAPANTVTLEINLANSGPLSDVQVRQAISAGIDRSQLASEGEYGQENAATSSSGLVLPVDSQLVPSQYNNDLSQDTSKVASILQNDGYTKGGNGKWAKGGQEITFNVEDPTSYTDYYADAQLLVQQLNNEGFNVSADGVTPDKWYSDLANGTFSTAIHWGTVAPTPYAQYDAWLDDSTTAAVGQPATNDYERFHSSTADAALSQYAASNDTATQQAAINQLSQIVSTQLPVIPLLYGAQWDEYSTAKVTNWPTASNPYMAPSPDDPQVGYILTQLKTG